ncbi:MAG TPA: 6-bladed beta-propeller, partial [Longimicrobium sp.]|nr:6-bladed beta-propeller [Longimicrobium sp.]
MAVSAPQATFTAVTALDVDSRGRVYVGDWYRQQVTVLGPDGSLVRTLGKRGDGPGEFRAIRGVQILSGDSLLVYDPTSARVTVYAADAARPAYTTNLRTGLAGPAPFYLWRTAANDGYVALFRPA